MTLGHSVGAPRIAVRSASPTLSLEIQETIHEVYPRIATDLNRQLDGEVVVHVANSDEEFLSLVGGYFPDWGLGCAIPERRTIVLRDPRLHGWNRSLREVIAHEMSHLLLFKAMEGNRPPRWLDEGVAMLESEVWSMRNDLTVAKAKLTGSLMTLEEIDEVNLFWREKASLAYAESFSAVQWLVSTHGRRGLRDVIAGLATTEDPELAFRAGLGYGFQEFQRRWLWYIGRRYGWTALFSDRSLFWILMALLFVMAFLMKRRRAQKTLDRWEHEEQLLRDDEESSPPF